MSTSTTFYRPLDLSTGTSLTVYEYDFMERRTKFLIGVRKIVAGSNPEAVFLSTKTTAEEGLAHEMHALHQTSKAKDIPYQPLLVKT